MTAPMRSLIPASMTKKMRHSKADRALELYETCPEATYALMKHERLPHTLWEASCGRGAIVKILRAAGHEVLATDWRDYRWEGQDASLFNFMHQTALPMHGIDAIIQNPPFSKAAEFTQKSIELCPLVYMLLPLRFLEAGNDTTEAGRARKFCLDAGHLSRVLVFTNRLPMMHRDGWSGPRATSTTAYAWYVFERDRKAPAHIYRISWEPLPATQGVVP